MERRRMERAHHVSNWEAFKAFLLLSFAAALVTAVGALLLKIVKAILG